MAGAKLACPGLYFCLRLLVDVSISSMVGLSTLCTALRRHSLRLLAKEIVAALGTLTGGFASDLQGDLA